MIVTDMKKLLLSMLLGMMALGALAQEGKFTVKGTFEEVGDTVSFVIYGAETRMEEIRATTGEMLEVTFDLNDVSDLRISKCYRDEMPMPSMDDIIIYVPAIPGETLLITIDNDREIHYGGSQFYLDYSEGQESVKQNIMVAQSIAMPYLMSKKSSGASDEEIMEEYRTTVMPAILQARVEAVKNYVKAHPDQDASAALLAELSDDIENVEAIAAMLTDRARNSAAAKLYKKNLAMAKSEREAEARQNALEGAKAPDFTLNDINGKPLALSSLRGKWVILDFWGSWCGWCIKGMPKMKEYYTKYNNKLEILGVDCNDTVEKWKKAVADNELPWLHVYCGKDAKEDPMVLYGVNAFPTKVIINPKGKVAKIIVGEDPAFYDYLDEMLK